MPLSFPQALVLALVAAVVAAAGPILIGLAALRRARIAQQRLDTTASTDSVNKLFEALQKHVEFVMRQVATTNGTTLARTVERIYDEQKRDRERLLAHLTDRYVHHRH